MENPVLISDATYRIECELGSGGGGVVYKAWHNRLQKYVVIKELKNGTGNNLRTQRNEVEALKNVKSPYLPQVLDFISENNRIFTVMELVDGKSFDKLIGENARFTQQQVVKWYGQLAQALCTIHAQNIVHRDIKPANIMLQPSGDVCLIDFNAALVGGNDAEIISRSLGYASPEQYEIFERYKNLKKPTIRYEKTLEEQSGLNAVPEEPGLSDNTVLLNNGQLTGNSDSTVLLTRDDDGTVLLNNSGDGTVLLKNDAPSSALERTGIIPPSIPGDIDWVRSDIYSLGATMYHLLTGRRPSPKAGEVVPISELGDFGEGLTYIIEQSMKQDPKERFPSSQALLSAVSDIHKFDSRWKKANAKKLTAAVVLPLTFAGFACCALLGQRAMAQDKEEWFYSAVYEIGSSEDPHTAYDNAMSIFPDRIDPYLQMASRLWNDGKKAECAEYIKQNLGNIAKFAENPDTESAFGEIYYILGNCYYFQSGSPDYAEAKNCFETAVAHKKDVPEYYRDYAVVLARTGDTVQARHQLEKAQVLNLNEDSLNLIKGEIFLRENDYASAEECFKKALETSDSDYLRYRAYYSLDEIYGILGTPEKSVELLKTADGKVPQSCSAEISERLADAYIKCREYDSAAAILQKLSEEGVPQLHIMQALTICYENSGKLDEAEKVLVQMADHFPNDYRVPMRRAFLEDDKQSALPQEERDYSLVEKYYDEAAALYAENVKPGESDTEMQKLDLRITELKAGKWLD